MTSDKRLIEDYLPIQAISAEASREKSVRKGHISTLHLWWARRPLVACRAAVYGALVPAERFIPENGPDNKKQSLGRANAAKFIERLCKYPGNPTVIKEAQRHILEAHAERLTKETGKKVTVEDIEEGRAPRPKVLDMFAGGGAIPLEALRLGCEAYALDLNPVAHIIQLCTLVYPQKYGKPDPNVRGMTGPKNAKGETTWGGLANEVRYWGEWVLKKVKTAIGDLYPLIPDPDNKGDKPRVQAEMWQSSESETVSQRYLVPIAYLWTRTVRCKNPSCGATVPLVRQTWLCKKKDRYVALRMIAPKGEKKARFEVVESRTEKGLGFDPAAFSKGGNATCPFCGTVADSDYIKLEGCAKRLGQQMMAVATLRPSQSGKLYITDNETIDLLPESQKITTIIDTVCREANITIPSEPMPIRGTLGFRIQAYGIQTWGDLFMPRQKLCLLEFAAAVKDAGAKLEHQSYEAGAAKAVVSYLGIFASRISEWNSQQCTWISIGEKIGASFGRHTVQMVWDSAEVNPFASASGNALDILNRICLVIERESSVGLPAIVQRGTATAIPWSTKSIDCVVTDPPYYDNVGYADISDFFYIWLKRSLGNYYPEHFATSCTPKKQETVAEPTRYGGSIEKAKRGYEAMMGSAFIESHRVLKSGGQLVVVYAHKTTLGWATLVDALRTAGFTVEEAWPLDTEKPGRLRSQESAALASSIFLVARKREGALTGSYEEQVREDLEKIVRERVDSLWKMGITGADLVIAAVGAGLRAFTRFSCVEYANGEDVPAEKFLAEVEGVVLETLLEKIFGVTGSGVAAVDGPSRFYVLWRYAYKAAEMEAGEAIVFTYGQNVELDGQNGLSSGSRALVEKKKGKYRLLDFSERGDDEKLGMPKDDGKASPLIDILHRILWLVENEPRKLNEFLDQARPDRERLRLVAQTLAGTTLEGGQASSLSGDGGRDRDASHPTMATTPAEGAALKKLVANWRALIEAKLSMLI